MYAEDMTTRASLLSPSLNWQPTKSCLTFYYFMPGSATGMLNVYMVPTGLPSERVLIWSRTEHQMSDRAVAKIDVEIIYSVRVSLSCVATLDVCLFACFYFSDIVFQTKANLTFPLNACLCLCPFVFVSVDLSPSVSSSVCLFLYPSPSRHTQTPTRESKSMCVCLCDRSL